MKGLLWKEWTILTSSFKRNVVFFAAFYGIISVLSRQAYMGYALVLVFALLTGATVSFDENSHWDTYARTLPVTPAQVIGCKYLIGLGGVGLGAAVAAVIAALVSLRSSALTYSETGAQSVGDVAAAILVCSSMALLFVAMVFPFSYKFNSINARSRIFLTFALFSAVIGLVISALPENR
ncbi:ABC-2 transporter permease, partial [Gemmiger sp.]